MKHKLLFILVTATSLAFGQPALEWQKTIGGSANDFSGDIVQTSDGGYVFGGHSASTDGDITETNGSYDFKLFKANSSGDIEWQKTYGGSGFEILSSFSKTPDGGYILIGYTTSNNGDVSGNHGGEDVWVVKVDNLGTIEWQKTYGGTDYDEGRYIQPTADNGYIFCGTARSINGDLTFNHNMETSGNSRDMWVVKIDNSGTIVWQKVFGGTNDESATSIKETAAGDYYLVGGTVSDDGDVTESFGNYDIWITKINSLGTMVWQKSYGGSNADLAVDLIIAGDGGAFLLCETNSTEGLFAGNHGLNDSVLMKINGEGNITWTKFYGGSSEDIPLSMANTVDGGFILSGLSTSSDNGINIHGTDGYADSWLVKTDNIGTLEWQKTLGGDNFDSAFSAIQTSDGGYVVSGNTESNNGDVTVNHGNTDIWIVKLGTDLGLDKTGRAAKALLYPNPVSNEINLLVSPDDIGSSYTISDLTGKILNSGTIKHENSIIPVSDLAQGIYTIGINNKLNIKFIKQ